MLAKKAKPSTKTIQLSFRSVEMWALRLILIEYARNPNNPQTFEDVLTDDTVTLSDLMSKLMPE
jgi:hypothetical protein